MESQVLELTCEVRSCVALIVFVYDTDCEYKTVLYDYVAKLNKATDPVLVDTSIVCTVRIHKERKMISIKHDKLLS